jgi:hypothetical protein
MPQAAAGIFRRAPDSVARPDRRLSPRRKKSGATSPVVRVFRDGRAWRVAGNARQGCRPTSSKAKIGVCEKNRKKRKKTAIYALICAKKPSFSRDFGGRFSLFGSTQSTVVFCSDAAPGLPARARTTGRRQKLTINQ